MSVLQAELFYDDETRNWHYRVPELRINGGGTQTRAEAEQECRAAIAFARLDLGEAGASAETIRFELNVGPGARVQPAAPAAPDG
jgi:hypothetical protein